MNMGIYILLYTLYSCVLYACMRWILAKGTRFSWNRWLIYASVLISCILPFVYLNTPISTDIFTVRLDMVEVIADAGIQSAPVTVTSFNLITCLSIVYLLGFLYFGVRVCIGLIRLNQIIKKGQKEALDTDITLVHSSLIQQPCSFFTYILLPKGMKYETLDLQYIIEHERQHVTLRHSIDNVFLAIHQTIFWFNPISHSWSKMAKLNHEYQVDALMQRSHKTYDYSQFLIAQIYQSQKLLLVHTIYSFIKKRIQMMYQKKSSGAKIYGLIGVAMIALFIFQACQKESVTETTSEQKSTQPIQEKETFYTQNLVDTVFVFNPETGTEEMRIVTSDRTVYNEPEIMPLVKECFHSAKEEDERMSCSQQKLLQSLYKNIKYPKSAKDDGVEGMVVSEFIINKGGGMEAYKVIKEVHPDIDKEVMRVLQFLSEELEWEPGKVEGEKVNVKYTLPVKFKLQ